MHAQLSLRLCRQSNSRLPVTSFTAALTRSLQHRRRIQPQHASLACRAVMTAAVDQHTPSTSRQLLSVAPMMDWTDLHYRQLARLLSRHTWLYTEMVVDGTLLHNNAHDRFLWFPPEQRPIVCQLGGSDPNKLAAAARIVQQYGYDEINLNCGCPSDRVAGAGCFGASLMLRPQLVADCCRAMAEAVSIPVTVKCRLGVDNVDSYQELCTFIATVSQHSPVRHFIMHCRKCLLKGLSPAKNRTVPLLRREWCWALARDFPHLHFSLNGQVMSCHQAGATLAHRVGGAAVHGVMIGRAAYDQPWDCLSDADRAVFGAATNAATSRRQVFEEYGRYGDAMLGRWEVKAGGYQHPNVRTLIKPLLNMFHGEAGSKKWKQEVDRVLRTATSVSQVLRETQHLISDVVWDAPPKQLCPDAVLPPVYQATSLPQLEPIIERPLLPRLEAEPEYEPALASVAA